MTKTLMLHRMSSCYMLFPFAAAAAFVCVHVPLFGDAGHIDDRRDNPRRLLAYRNLPALRGMMFSEERPNMMSWISRHVSSFFYELIFYDFFRLYIYIFICVMDAFSILVTDSPDSVQSLRLAWVLAKWLGRNCSESPCCTAS